MKSRIIRIIVFVLIGMGIGFGILYVKKDQALDSGVTEIQTASILKAPVAKTESTDLKSDIGGPFTLTDQNGQTVTQETYKDSYKLVFFGFTYCPVICPTELQKVKQIMETVPPETAAKIQPLFVTVDPERDTPERLKEYLAQFHPRQVGLTGTPEQIEAIKQAYRVYASRVENEHMEGYMFDHSTFMYLMNPEGKLVAIYPMGDKAEQIAADITGRNL